MTLNVPVHYSAQQVSLLFRAEGGKTRKIQELLRRRAEVGPVVRPRLVHPVQCAQGPP